MSNLCAICKKNAENSCSACNEVFYCCREHQKQDWKVHKQSCAPYKIQTNPVMGRFLVATRDINPGEVIMKKLPLILGPKMVSTPLCLGCHKRLNEDKHGCSKCKWPLCSKGCENSPNHREECDLFAKASFKPNIQDCGKQTAYCSIAPLRALLLKKESKKFETVINCQSHLDQHKKTQVYDVLKRNLVPLFINVLKLDTSEEEILKICSILDTNTFEVRDGKGLVNIRGLYPIMTLLSHSCKRNTKHNFFGDDFKAVLTATIPIKKGQAITTSYTQTLWGTLIRRAHLKMAKNFDCVCDRCKDPTEFGLYVGSILCSNCEKGKMLSTNPLDRESSFKCGDCGYEMQSKQMIWGNEALKKEISMLDKSNPEAFESFLLKYKNLIHEKNSHSLEVKYALSQMYGNMPGHDLDELSPEMLERKIGLCHELLEIAEVLEPGFSRFRGSLLYDLQSAMVAKAKVDFAQEKITKAAAEDILNQSVKYLQEASKILASEPDLNEVLQNRLRNLQKLCL